MHTYKHICNLSVVQFLCGFPLFTMFYSIEPYHMMYNPPSDPKVENRLVAVDDVPSNIEYRIAEFRRHFIAITQIYKDIMVTIQADRPLSDLYSVAMCHLTRPARNPVMWTPRVILIGFSGSGRKTVASKLAKQYELITIHCGTLIRREVIRETKLGNAMKIYVDAHSSGEYSVSTFMRNELQMINKSINQQFCSLCQEMHLFFCFVKSYLVSYVSFHSF